MDVAIRRTGTVSPGYMEDAIMKGPYTVAELRKAFEAVQDPDDWRAEIDAWIDHEDYNVTNAAITFFTGAEIDAVTQVTPIKGMGIHAVGYRNGPCGP